MTIVLGRPPLHEVLPALREWQVADAPLQLHPGDLGWQCRFGAESISLRAWRRDGVVVAVGYLDEPTVLRVAIAPELLRDQELGQRMADDIASVLPEGKVALEVAQSALVRELLGARGWVPDEPWTPLRLDLSGQLAAPDLRIEVVGPPHVQDRTAVQRAAFAGSTFTDERWHVMAAGPLYADARCLVGYDADGRAVAAVTVWSAGEGKAGLLEPLGVHPDHRGHGYGVAISVAAALALQELGASCAQVCTPSANVGAVATYVSAGFTELGIARDLART